MIKRGVKPDSSRERIFEVSEIDSDKSFIRNYLTKELVNREGLFLFVRKDNEVVVSSTDWEKVCDELCWNSGECRLSVYRGRRWGLHEKCRALPHPLYEGIDLDILYLEKVFMHVHRLWGRTVHIETMIEEKKTLFSCDGTKVHRKRLN